MDETKPSFFMFLQSNFDVLVSYVAVGNCLLSVKRSGLGSLEIHPLVEESNITGSSERMMTDRCFCLCHMRLPVAPEAEPN